MHSKLVYKYVTADRIDILKDNRIRFTQPDALNDPFEALPCLLDFKKSLFENISNKTAAKFGDNANVATQEFGKDMIEVIAERFPQMLGNLFAFLSVSSKFNNPLMWSHYANSHTGFVIGFDSTNQFFQPGAHCKDGLMPIKYSPKRYVLPGGGLSHLNEAALDEANAGILLTKSTDWSYEEELRLFAMPKDATKILKPQDCPPVFLYEFPISAVEVVVLGMRMAQKHKDEIAGLLSEKYPHASLFQAVLDDTNFLVDCIPYKKALDVANRLSTPRDLIKIEFTLTDEDGREHPAPWSN